MGKFTNEERSRIKSIGNVTYDEQTYMCTMNGKLKMFSGSQCIDSIDGSLKLFERRS